MSYRCLLVKVFNLFSACAILIILWQCQRHLRSYSIAARSVDDSSTALLLASVKRFSSSGGMLILALSADCPYCRKGSNFYRAVIRKANQAGIKTVTLMQTDSPRGPSALLTLGVEESQRVEYVDLSGFGLATTPNLIFQTAAEAVPTVWRGALGVKEESALIDRLNFIVASVNASSSKRNPAEDSRSELDRLASELQENRLTILDIRERDQFRREHIKGAINIPYDELEPRLIHELDRSTQVVVYCRYELPCAQGVYTRSLCTLTRPLFESMHNKDAIGSFIDAGFEDLKRAGVQVEDSVEVPAHVGNS